VEAFEQGDAIYTYTYVYLDRQNTYVNVWCIYKYIYIHVYIDMYIYMHICK
jgi:hypothetical protein